MSAPESSHRGTKHALFLLTLGALGVVYGDIGTSPLYAIKEIFFGQAIRHFTSTDVLGAISLVFWALTLVVAFKYVFVVMRADYEGEGGVFALYGLIRELKKKAYLPLLTLLVIAAGLLYGDGIITPAISVISSVEGLSLVTKFFDPYIVPITIAILTGLFFIQSKGTAKVGSIFGPIMLVWFIAIGGIGFMHVLSYPAIIAAINPYYAIIFLFTHTLKTVLLVLGAVMLAITGGEAMYADMGHFGRLPIRIGWYVVAYPALILSYLGQGAFLLSGQPVVRENLFFSMVPHLLLVPMVLLATAATVIASQALISGAFSLTMQAISLGLVPYLPAVHTHKLHEGQIYIPFVNWMLYIGSVALVLVFQSSNRLAAAYGLAVSGVMFVTTLGMIVIAGEYWKWKKWAIYSLFLFFLFIDYIFVMANSLKFLQGGYIPVYIGLIVLILIKTWEWGRSQVRKTYESYPVMRLQTLINHKEKGEPSIPRTVVIMSRVPVLSVNDPIPMLNQILWDRYGLIPQNILFLTVSITNTPHAGHHRYNITKLYDHGKHGTITSVVVNFGFMEDPNVEHTLEGLAAHHEVPIDEDHTKWLVYVVHERILPGRARHLINKLRFSLYLFLQRNTDTADHYFGLGQDQPLTIEVLPVRLK